MGFWSQSKVLVTGANGFAGSNLCKQLVEREARVYALVRDNSNLLNLKEILPKITLVYGDVRYPETLDNAIEGKDFVFNFAAKVNIEETRRNPSETMRTNINGAFNVADACRKYHVQRFVQISTCHIYGNTKDSELPIDEHTTPRPVDVYSISKYSAELLVNNVRSTGLNVVVTRAFNHYGPGQTGNFLIAKVIKNLLNNQQPMLGSSKPTRDYCYIDDIVKGYVFAAEKGREGEIYHFSSGREVSIGEMYEKICEAVGIRISPIWQGARENDMLRSFGSYSKAKSQLGWSPETSLENGLKKTVDWWKNNKILLLSA